MPWSLFDARLAIANMRGRLRGVTEHTIDACTHVRRKCDHASHPITFNYDIFFCQQLDELHIFIMGRLISCDENALKICSHFHKPHFQCC